MSDEALRAAGITPSLIRVSVGYTGSAEQRWGQLERALARIGLIATPAAAEAPASDLPNLLRDLPRDFPRPMSSDLLGGHAEGIRKAPPAASKAPSDLPSDFPRSDRSTDARFDLGRSERF